MAGGLPNKETGNVFKAPHKMWDSWKPEARALFNYMLSQAVSNREKMCGGVEAPIGDLAKLFDTFSFNLACMTADQANKIINTDDSRE